MSGDPALVPAKDLASRNIYDAVLGSLDVRQTTIDDYAYRLKHFQRFIEEHGVSHDLLLRYKRNLEAHEDYSISTKNKYLACAKTFLRQCRSLGIIGNEIFDYVSFFKQSKKHKKNGITELEATQIRNWMEAHPDKKRENALLCLLMYQGLRQAEICNIRLSDVLLDDQHLWIRSKGHDDKDAIYLHRNTRLAVRTYVKDLGDVSPNDYLFSSRSRKGQSGKLTERGLRFIVRTILDELRIDKNVHGFRHYFTTHLIKVMPGELLKVAHFTRHQSLEMLQVYNDSVVEEEDMIVFESAFNFAR